MCSDGFEAMRAAPPAQTATKTSQEEYKALVRRWIEQGFNNKDVTVVDELFIPEVIVNGQRVGRLGLKQSMTRFIKAFPNLRVTITEVVAEEDKVGIWYTVQGTQAGEFEGIRATVNRCDGMARTSSGSRRARSSSVDLWTIRSDYCGNLVRHSSRRSSKRDSRSNHCFRTRRKVKPSPQYRADALSTKERKKCRKLSLLARDGQQFALEATQGHSTSKQFKPLSRHMHNFAQGPSVRTDRQAQA
jgi:predicted ester cyclase